MKRVPFNILLQYCLPQHLLSRGAGMLSNCKWKWFKNWAIRRLIRKYNANPAEAVSDNLDSYPDFNSFFTRHLKPEARPIAAGDHIIASPVDGTVSQAGNISAGTLFQAKNFYFSTESLLGGETHHAEKFREGIFATLYLAPGDYHRVHMPFTGTLTETVYIPGKLFSVNPLTTEFVPSLFACNERLACLFDTAVGPMAVILIGAMMVGHIKTVWADEIRTNTITSKKYPPDMHFAKGAELGHFLMGSTVIVLFGNSALHWRQSLLPGTTVRMGEEAGNI